MNSDLHFKFTPEGSVPVQSVTCSREVILAAGAINTPQILELSGIGPADLVEKFDIPSNLDLPGVGNNLQTPPSVEVPYSIPYSCKRPLCCYPSYYTAY